MHQENEGKLTPWWKESVIYQIYPRSFQDSNGDGIGDIPGIISRLDHIHGLGVDVIWLSPFYPSPNADMGYDIADYKNIHTDYGTMEDFDHLLSEIHSRGMKLIIDIVLNHTSETHPWFIESRSSIDNPYRRYYFWKDPAPGGGPPNNWQSFFGGPAWTFDHSTGQYYLHLFTKEQPDVNWENEHVRQAYRDILRFWLDKGVDGFRLDVIPLISKRLDFKDTPYADFQHTIQYVYSNGDRIHEYIKWLHHEVFSDYPVMTLGEGPGIMPSNVNLYTGNDRSELNMIYHLDHMFIDFGDGDKFDHGEWTLEKFMKIFDEWDEALGDSGWISISLDNHDFPRMVSRFGNDGEYWKQSAKLLATCILTMRGTPGIYQGSEIGMKNVAFQRIEDYRDVETLNFHRKYLDKGFTTEEFLKRVHRQGRDNARTPVQWSDAPNGGFTTGEPWIGVHPEYREINAANALDDPDSIYYYYRDMIALRKQNPVLVTGVYKRLSGMPDNIFAYSRQLEGEIWLVVLNFYEGTAQIVLPPGVWKSKINNYGPSGELYRGSTQLEPWQSMVLKKN